MALHRARSRYSAKGVTEEMSSLSSTLARVQRITGTNKIAMARKIGYAMGVELASKKPPYKQDDIHSELASLFRQLNLGKVFVHEWEPVVFVTCPDSKAESLEAAFGQGVLEGVMHRRRSAPVFVEHSYADEIRQRQFPFGFRNSRRGEKGI